VRLSQWEPVFIPFTAFVDADPSNPLRRTDIRDARIGLPAAAFPVALIFNIAAINAVRVVDNRG
jgi:hypothetical protein